MHGNFKFQENIMTDMDSKHILLVEDEEHIAEGIALNLKTEGFDCVHTRDGRLALDIFERENFDLVILDVMLPGIDGFEVCRRIRRLSGAVPIMFLTARDSLQDKKEGLTIGGDDYITKPFDLEELILRIRAIFRRQAWLKADDLSPGIYRFTGGTIDFRKYTADSPRGRFHLTNKECLLLKYFSQNPNEVLSRNMILDAVWGYNAYPSTRTIDNFILRFRKYFEPDPSSPIYFHTEFGTGYKFTPRGIDKND
jgi:two-component system alkaline phosphatase synthesis response regulator PhoP